MTASPLRELVRRHGWAFSAEQAANSEMRAWTIQDGSAGVAYRSVRRWPGGPSLRITAGDPLAPREQLEETARAFEADSRDVVWFGASDALRSARRSELVLGAEPVLNVEAWDDTLRSKASLRAQVARARNKGVACRELPAGVALEPYAVVLEAWLATRGLPALHFLAQPAILDAPGDRRFILAERAGEPIALLSLCPVPTRSASLVEWVLRRPEAPNGTAALLIDTALRAEAARGTTEISLGLVPLSKRAPLSPQAPSLAVRAALAWTRAHARRFYHFDGLERFKAKFQPDRWEPVYLLSTRPRVGLGTLYAVADAFAGPRSPERLVGRALVDAARDEIRTLTTRR